MKNIMEVSTQRQLQLLCHIAHMIDDFEWPKKLGAQLPVTLGR
jgi:hypothetical protein